MKMASKVESNDEESFIVLGTSPGASLELNGVERFYGDASLDYAQLDDALKDLSEEASMAFKAHFKLGDGPSPASLMAASTIITDDRSTEELQKRFGELLDENVILKETLKQNNDSMKEQFLMIASCQEDMMKTHMVHKEKFDETRDLVEKLRQENKKLKSDVARLAEVESAAAADSETGEHGESGPPSALEFVASPDDDTIDKLTAQLELVEKQRRQVIMDNDKLTWQKESLEHIVDATSKERDDLKEKIKKLELQLCSVDSENILKINNLNCTIQELENKLQAAKSVPHISPEEVTKRDAIIQQFEAKVSALQGELKKSQLKILDLENVKLEFSKYKSGSSDSVKIYKDQIQELRNKLKEAQTTVFQPVRFSISSEAESNSEFASFISNVKLYDKTLKHLSDLLNLVTHGASDSLVGTLGLVASLHDFKLDRTTAEQFKAGLADVKQQLERQHSTALNNIGQVKNTLTIFEGIFKEYNELLKKSLNKQESRPSNTPNVEALTAGLLARGHEIEQLKTQLFKLRTEKEDCELMKAQLYLYKSDFEAERDAREKMACEKENALTDFRQLQRRYTELSKQMEDLRKMDSAPRSGAPRPQSQQNGTGPVPGPFETPRHTPGTPTGSATGNKGRKKKKLDDTGEVEPHETTPPPLRFDCPVCDQPFKSLILLQQHVDSCLL